MFHTDEIENALDYLFKTNAYLTRNEHLAMVLLNEGLLSGHCSGTVESGISFLESRGYQTSKVKG